ncbi:MAG: DsbA family protein [Patescibacteria group bacterium]|nr:DsbA family protein [Patescibacteria group bacterium]
MKLSKEDRISAAVVLGSILISLSILVSSGVITLKNSKPAATSANTTPTTQANTTQPSQQATVTLDKVKDVFNKSVIKFGDTNKKLIAIEVADPSCPYCQIAAGKNPELNKQAGSRFTLVADGGTYVAPVPEIKKLVDEGKAAFAYLYFPGHGNGEMGAKALFCAQEAGKFWDVNDMLMSAQGYDLLNNTVKNDKSKSGDLANFLQPVFDPAAMKQCLDSGKYDNTLKEDMALANGLNVSGTPGFFLNTTAFAGAYSYTDMESTVNSFLK